MTAGDKNHALIHVDFMNVVVSRPHYWVSFQKNSDFFVFFFFFFPIVLNVQI